ncbi:RmlC-like cupin domain-containing protein [Stachybotrys elegans]|uniref:Mannose-6-phosphate isomerase n=1 Tax=Stachybotrys elegans TaxID=80388 RepID=A0A8K0SW05_9HYPO|nr:RmlC-like cupin domain-containing protein [Stachybotrys elegans]
MATPLEPFYQLQCSCNSYPWGKKGSQSLAARLCAKTPGYINTSSSSSDGSSRELFTIDESTPYAEMWMGTYPSLPSLVASTGEPLQSVLDRHATALLGPGVLERFGHSNLPFLPKVLSIAKALPLQIHPDKEAAARLHAQNPEKFPDANHKPEIALAVSRFEAFCGFKPLTDIAEALSLKPTAHFLTYATLTSSKLVDEDLRPIIQAILESPDSVIKQTYEGLISLPESAFTPANSHIPKLAPRLAKQFDESDPGILVALLTMNYLILNPGDALYIPADGIHAYLSGDIIECMARSDNVINTGFCPRPDRDSAAEFCSLLTFRPHELGECMLSRMAYWRSEKGKTSVFQPPLSEFNFLETTLGPGEEELLGKGGPSILLATRGSATIAIHGGDKSFELGEGHVYFISRGVALDIKAKEDGLLMHTAYYE